jgi:hypothetical protein
MINDELRELLSAYADGALSEPARREVEARLEGSEELRRELADLRAVAEAVRSLPKHPAPEGLAARVRLRRAGGEAPTRDWVFLPPSLRPVVLALSCGVVALFIWQNVVVRTPFAPPEPPAARLTTEADAPLSQLDVSAAAGGGPSSDAAKAASSALGLAPTPSAGPSLVRARAKGRALDEEATAADGAPLDRAVGAAAGSAGAISEQARSARNVEMFADLERQKKEMGIAGVAPSDRAASGIAALRGAAMLPPEDAPAPVLGHGAPNVMAPETRALKAALGAAAAAPAAPAAEAPAAASTGRQAPDAALVFTDPRSLASSWIVLGFPKDPPAVDFAKNRAVLIKPSVSRILSVTATRDAVIVVYRTLGPDEPSDPLRDRFAILPLEPDTVQIIDATPR